MTLTNTLKDARGRGKKAVARLARRVLPRTTSRSRTSSRG